MGNDQVIKVSLPVLPQYSCCITMLLKSSLIGPLNTKLLAYTEDNVIYKAQFWLAITLSTVTGIPFSQQPRSFSPVTEHYGNQQWNGLYLHMSSLPLSPDVDVVHPDEKSIITYVSSLYDVMPRVPDVQDGVKANVSPPQQLPPPPRMNFNKKNVQLIWLEVGLRLCVCV